MSIAHLVLANLGALLFVGMFRLQRHVLPSTYFSAIPLVYGVAAGVKYSLFLVRLVLVAAFSAVAFAVVQDALVTAYAVGLGSLLVVWPGMLYPEYLEWYARERIWAAWLLFLGFIGICVGASLLAVAAVVWAKPEAFAYYDSLRQPGAGFGFFMSVVVGLALAKAWTHAARWMGEERDFS